MLFYCSKALAPRSGFVQYSAMQVQAVK